jgi:hypothetical protein
MDIHVKLLCDTRTQCCVDTFLYLRGHSCIKYAFICLLSSTYWIWHKCGFIALCFWIVYTQMQKLFYLKDYLLLLGVSCIAFILYIF